MKIEVGESLIYSFLKHEKQCLISQMNWKPSGNWQVLPETHDLVKYEFDIINKHHAFSDIFKSNFDQTIKQAEIDVLGIDTNNQIYAFEVAFHENGLQYGGKIETRNRIIKKLLRSHLILKYYFPSFVHNIAFCSPKVNPATEKHILDYFEMLNHDFTSGDAIFSYFSNDKFSREIGEKVIEKTINESDSGELFSRSIKLLNVISQQTVDVQEPLNDAPDNNNQPVSINSSAEMNEFITVKGIRIPLSKDQNETVQDFVKKVMRLLLDNNILEDAEILRLKNKEYSKKTFNLQFPLLREIHKGHKDNTGRGRYWSPEVFGGNYYICSQWWKAHHATYQIKIKQWLCGLS